MNLHKYLNGAFMSLKLQTINVMTHRREQLSCTMPAEHIYPFIVHRSVAEYLEKKDGERTRYSKKHILTHLLTGAQIGVFGRYEHALIVARKLKNKPIFLMPTYDLLTTHPDVPEVGVVVRELKRLYAID
tara:strand:- start:2202 stop:2591 length:390 start_codon:yes stop_codon:yes gene_type:complete